MVEVGFFDVLGGFGGGRKSGSTCSSGSGLMFMWIMLGESGVLIMFRGSEGVFGTS